MLKSVIRKIPCIIITIITLSCDQPVVSGITVEAPEFSEPSGFYDEEVIVEISSPTNGSSIRYTTDGTDPTESLGILYSGPITISKTALIKAIALKDSNLPSTISYRNYYIKTTQLDLRIRDFTPLTNTDFEYNSIGADLGIVNSNLGEDKIPVYNHIGSTLTVHSPTTFYQWFRDIEGVNIGIQYYLNMVSDVDGLHYSNADFFPINGIGFGNTPGYGRNYHFTMSYNGIFYYDGNESITIDITANDDTWLFINNKLVIDMGGIQSPKAGSFTLTSLNSEEIGISSSGVYNFDLFHAQRHTTTSSFSLSTNAILLK